MIHAMREAGYDRRLRAGQSMTSLGLSRSRRHGLLRDQPCIWLEFHHGAMNVHAKFAGVRWIGRPVDFTAEVRQLLDRLACFDID
jgi:hypothetical protein